MSENNLAQSSSFTQQIEPFYQQAFLSEKYKFIILKWSYCVSKIENFKQILKNDTCLCDTMTLKKVKTCLEQKGIIILFSFILFGEHFVAKSC